MVQIEYYVILSAILFILGAMGVLLRRNAILVYMSVELMLNAANLALVAFAKQWNNMDGQLFVFFVMTVAAAEVAIGLALIVAIFRTKHSTSIDQLHQMEG
jgi:NADH-quinone oxidoreductase subunit K